MHACWLSLAVVLVGKMRRICKPDFFIERHCSSHPSPASQSVRSLTFAPLGSRKAEFEILKHLFCLSVFDR